MNADKSSNCANRDLFGDLDSVSIQADDLAGMVGEHIHGSS
jgi:hypothetical protein